MNTSLILDGFRRYLVSKHEEQALMLSGSWGVGKTYFCKEQIEPLARKLGMESIHVSLYGVESESQLIDLLIEGFLGVEGLGDNKISSAGKILGGLANELDGATKDSSGLVAAVFSGFTSAVKGRVSKSWGQNTLFIFDDLERSSAKKDTVLGWIHRRLEVSSSKALIICNEDAVSDDDPISYKEKVVAHTYKFSPGNEYIIDAALDRVRKAFSLGTGSNFITIAKEVLGRTDGGLQLSNIRTVVHALSSTYQIAIEAEDKINDPYRLRELIQAGIFYAVAYRDRDVPISKLNELATDPSATYSTSFFSDGNESDGITSLDDSFKEFLSSSAGFPSVWNLIRDGYFDVQQFEQDSSHWLQNRDQAIPRLIHEGAELSDQDLEAVTRKVISGMEQGSLEFLSYGEAFTVLIKLRWMVKKEALEFDEKELDSLSIQLMDRLLESNSIIPDIGMVWEDDIAEDEYLPIYHEKLRQQVELHRESMLKKAFFDAVVDGFQPDVKPDLDAIRCIQDKPVLTEELAERILKEAATAHPKGLINLGRMMAARYGEAPRRGKERRLDQQHLAKLSTGLHELADKKPLSNSRRFLRRVAELLE